MPREIGTIWKEGRWWKTQMAFSILTSRTLKQAKVFAEWAESQGDVPAAMREKGA